jgi:hypothetical protein
VTEKKPSKFDIFGKSKPINYTVDQTVTSYDQKGGITAHTVNIGKQEFDITEAHVQQILSTLKQGDSVDLTCIGNKPAQRQMFDTLCTYLRSKGIEVHYSLIGMTTSMPGSPFGVSRHGTTVYVSVAPDA